MRVFRALGWMVGILLGVSGGVQVTAEDAWLVRTKGGTTQHILRHDGTITKTEPQRGDKKTDYSQSQNRCHSEQQRAKGVDCGDTDQEGYALDLTGWSVAAQGGQHTDWEVTYLNATEWTTHQVIVTFDLTTGTVKSVREEWNTTTTEPPDISGMTLVSSYTREDGSTQEVYFNQDRTANAIVDYDANGEFVKARLWTRTEVSPESVSIPQYCSDTYGCTK